MNGQLFRRPMVGLEMAVGSGSMGAYAAGRKLRYEIQGEFGRNPIP